MTSPEYQAPTWVNEDDPDFLEGVSPDLGAGYLNTLSGAVEDHGQRLGAITPVVTNLQNTALDQATGDNRYILQTNASTFAPAEATTAALAALPFRAENVATTAAAVGRAVTVTQVGGDGKASRFGAWGPCHVVVGGGQSNNTQSDATIPGPIVDPRLMKWDGTAIVPLPVSETYLLPSFAREYVKTLPAADWVLVVPAAVGSTGFTSTSINPPPAGYNYYPSSGTWDRTLTADTNNLYLQMVAKTNAAEAAAVALTSAPVTVDALLWSQGEGDTPFLTESQYAAKLDDLIAQFRIDMGDTLLPVLIGSMVPEYGYARGQVNTAGVAAALANTPARTPNGSVTAFVWGPEGMPKLAEPIHYSTQAQFVRGRLFAEALLRARANRAATKPVAPAGLSLVREASGLVTLRWQPPTCRVTGYDVDFSFDSGATWIVGSLDPDSRLKATSAALPWETVKARIRTKNDSSTPNVSDYAYSVELPSPRDVTVGTLRKFTSGENLAPAHTGAMTLYHAFTLPASGGEATISARANDSTRTLALSAIQAAAADNAIATTGGGTVTNSFPAPKAVAGPHVNAVALAADGGSILAKRGASAATTVTGTTGNILAETLRIATTGGAVSHGAYLVLGAAHAADVMATVQEILRQRHGLTSI